MAAWVRVRGRKETPMIYTLTTNPAVDMNISAKELAPNRVIRTSGAVYTPNGKGLNVSFTLRHYGIDSTILGFFGGFTGDYIVRKAARTCPVLPVMIDGTTRVNVFLSVGLDEYTLPNVGAPVNRNQQLEMLSVMRGLNDLEVLSVSGSLSPKMESSYYNELIEVAQSKGAEVVLDISSGHLAELIERRPLLIKPNGDELRSIFGLEAHDEQGAIDALRQLRARGAQNVLLTLGDRGAYFSGADGIWHASAARVRTLSTACAGDAALASFMSVWLEDPDRVEDALVRSMATGASVAASAGLGDFSKVDKLAGQIVVRRVR